MEHTTGFAISSLLCICQYLQGLHYKSRQIIIAKSCHSSYCHIVWTNYSSSSPHSATSPSAYPTGVCILPTYILIIKGLSKVVNYRKSISGVSSAINATAAYIGRNTIVILAVQNYIIGFIKILFASSIIRIESAEDYTMAKFALNIAITLTTIITSIPIIYLINKYTPWFIGRGAFWKRKLQQYS